MAKDLTQAEIDEMFSNPFGKKVQRQTYIGEQDIDVTGYISPAKKTTKKAVTKPKIIKPKIIGDGSVKTGNTITPKVFGDNSLPPMGKLSKPDIISATNKQTNAIQEQTKTIQDVADKQANAQLFLAAAKFGVDVMNANSAYGAVAAASRLNIMESRRLANDAIERGKQRALEAQAEGMQAGENALLALAAQGQDVQGANAQKVQGSLEDIGLYNGLQEEVQGIREALGYDLEEVSINYQVAQAEIERDNTILSSGLQFGATAYATL